MSSKRTEHPNSLWFGRKREKGKEPHAAGFHGWLPGDSEALRYSLVKWDAELPHKENRRKGMDLTLRKNVRSANALVIHLVFVGVEVQRGSD